MPGSPSAAASHVARRGVLATAMALAGGSLLAGTAEAADRTPTPERQAPGTGTAPSGGTLVIDGGTLLDPLTGEVTPDSVVVVVDDTVRAAGSLDATRRARAALPAGMIVVAAHGRWVLPGLVDAHIHINSLAEAGWPASRTASARPRHCAARST